MGKIDQSVIGDIERLFNEHLVEVEFNREAVLRLFCCFVAGTKDAAELTL